MLFSTFDFFLPRKCCCSIYFALRLLVWRLIALIFFITTGFETSLSICVRYVPGSSNSELVITLATWHDDFLPVCQLALLTRKLGRIHSFLLLLGFSKLPHFQLLIVFRKIVINSFFRDTTHFS